MISVASAGNPNVKALVYVDTFAPDTGESPGSLLAPYPAPILWAGLYIRCRGYEGSRHGGRTASVDASGSHRKSPQKWRLGGPSVWYVAGDDDLVIPPALQLKMAEPAKAHISHAPGSDPSMVEHPEATVAAIMAAMSGRKLGNNTQLSGEYILCLTTM